jgi:uncharacterized protein YdaU (DUF1376 family)
MNAAIDLNKIPGLAPLVEEMETTKKPREIKRGDRIVAVLAPTEKVAAKTNLMHFFGSWKEVDTERLKEDIYADRTRNANNPSTNL